MLKEYFKRLFTSFPFFLFSLVVLVIGIFSWHWAFLFCVAMATSMTWTEVINPWLDERNRNKVHFIKPKDWNRTKRSS